MGTRSITHIKQIPSLGGEVVCSFYRHSDGYPEGHGKEMADFLSGKRVVNGVGSEFDKSSVFNRSGKMAVKLMAALGDSAEVIPTGHSNYGEEYVYTLWVYASGEVAIDVSCVHSDGKYSAPSSAFDCDAAALAFPN